MYCRELVEIQQAIGLIERRLLMLPPRDNSEKRLLRAAKHVNDHWFPINQDLLFTIQRGFDNEAFKEGVEPILLLLKKDFALFSYVTKELIPIAEAHGVSAAVRANPPELIRWAGVDHLKDILMNEMALPSTHHIAMNADFQNARLRETTIVVSTAEVLSEQQDLDPEKGFTRGVVREIGLNLIAWNYPTLYARVLKTLTPRNTLDDLLTQELGFSPNTLAMHLLHPKGAKDKAEERRKIDEMWAVYDDLCLIGEALSRANNPDTYPTAENDWEMAEEYISKTVGESGLGLIRTRALEHAQEYIAAFPGAFEALHDINPHKAINAHQRGSRALTNQYLKHCPEHLQATLRSLYSDMPRSHVNKGALERLFKEVIPAAGFTGGCIFVVDPSTMALTPRTVIGTVQLRQVRRVALKSLPGNSALVSETILTTSGSSGDLAAAAFACVQPLLERTDNTGDDALVGIYSSLGTKRRVGVLYLEVPEKKLTDHEAGALQVFKALRQALCDALLVE